MLHKLLGMAEIGRRAYVDPGAAHGIIDDLHPLADGSLDQVGGIGVFPRDESVEHAVGEDIGTDTV